MKLTEIQIEAVLELEEIADKYKNKKGKSWSLAIKERPDLHLIINNSKPAALTRYFRKYSRIKNGLCRECGLEKMYRSGLCEKHFIIRYPKKFISRPFEINFKIENIEVEVYKHKVIIRNCKTLKSVKFHTDSTLSVKDKVNQTLKQLLFLNKRKPPIYKSIFEGLIEALKFKEKLKEMVNEFELCSQVYTVSTASEIK